MCFCSEDIEKTRGDSQELLLPVCPLPHNHNLHYPFPQMGLGPEPLRLAIESKETPKS